MGQPAERRHALGGGGGGRPDAVVGQTVPIGQPQRLYVLGEEAQGLGESLGARRVAGDEDDGRGDLVAGALLQHVGDRQGVKPLRRAR